jgi:hypothetical protein
MPSDLITVAEAGRRLGITRQAIHHLIESGQLKAQWIETGPSPYRVVRQADVDALAGSRRKPNRKPAGE